MGKTKEKLQRGETTFGGWVMIAHPTVVELMVGEQFDWICLDMEHTSIDMRSMHECLLAAKGSDVDMLVRLPSHEPSVAKRALDAGAAGVVVPFVNTGDDARAAVAMTKFPPLGNRGASLARSTDFGRRFKQTFEEHNDRVIVVVMIEHVDALDHLDQILTVPGIDATFIGPYDLSASMGLAGQLDHPRVLAAQEKIIAACKRHGVPGGYHVVAPNPETVKQRIEEGFRFLACGIDTEFIVSGCRNMLNSIPNTPPIVHTLKEFAQQ